MALKIFYHAIQCDLMRLSYLEALATKAASKRHVFGFLDIYR